MEQPRRNEADVEDTGRSTAGNQDPALQKKEDEENAGVSGPMDGEDTAGKDAFIVHFESGDPRNPLNFPVHIKGLLTLGMGVLALTGSVGSSIITPAENDISADMHTSREVTVLALSLFLLGYAFGPMIWAPISEVYGRRWSILPGVFVLGLFSIGSARSKSAASLFVTRFLGGVFGSAPISNTTAALGDFYPPQARGIPMAFLALCVVGGPTIAPIVGAALTVDKHLGWRWTEYMEAIFVFSVLIVAFFTMPETYGPVLLGRKAQMMRKTSGDDRYWHPHEKQAIGIGNIMTKHLSRPLRMFFTEPMVTCIALYASFVYGLLFLTLEVFPIVFLEQRRYGVVTSTLPFLGLFVGVIFALTVNIANQPLYARAVKRNHGRAAPEARLPPMLVGGVFFSAGLFWFGWTAAPKYPWPLPVVAAGFIGAGFNIIFQQCLNFLVDIYGPYAASAVAANNFMRSLMACGLPLAARPMFLRLGVGPASSLLGGISCLALPVPLIFMRYAGTLRKMWKFAPPAGGGKSN
ncbi:MFS general substrate transporter, partial [Aureobasidium melanogenum]